MRKFFALLLLLCLPAQGQLVSTSNLNGPINGYVAPVTYSSATTASAVTRAGAITHININLLAAPSGYVANVPFSDSGFSAGDEIKATVIYPASANAISAMFYDGSTSGTLVLGTSGTTNGGTITHNFVFTGTAWTLLKNGALYAKNANLPSGPVVLDANGNIPFNRLGLNQDNISYSAEGDSITYGYNLTTPGTQCWPYKLSQLPFFANHLITYNGTINGTSPSAGATAITLNSALGFAKGQVLSGPGIASGTIITLVASNALTLSLPTTGTVSTVTAQSYYNDGVSGTFVPEMAARYPTDIYPHRPWASVASAAGTGTIAIDTSGNVTGSGTAFTTQLALNGTIFVGGNRYTVQSIASSTSATVSPSPAVAIPSASTFTFGGDGGAVAYHSFMGGINDCTAITNTTSGSTSSGSSTIVVTSSASFRVGMTIGNITPLAGVTSGTTITAINNGTNTLTLSANTTATIASGASIEANYTLATIVSNISSYITQARTDGFTVIAHTLLPVLSSTGVNETIREGVNLAYGTEQIPYDYLSDPTTVLPDANSISGTNPQYQSDGIHPSQYGTTTIANYDEQGLESGAFKINANEGTFGTQIVARQGVYILNPTSTATSWVPFYAFQSLMPTSTTMSAYMGHDVNVLQSLHLGFSYAGSGSTSNAAYFGVGQNDLKVDGTGTVTVTSNSTASTNIILTNTSTGGHSMTIAETGSANAAGAGVLQFYDSTNGKYFQYLTNGTLEDMSGPIAVDSLGSGLQVKEGANAKQGTFTLVSGTVTISDTAVGASSRIQLTPGAINSSTALGVLHVSSQTSGAGFTITSYIPGGTSTQTGDLSGGTYFITDPGP